MVTFRYQIGVVVEKKKKKKKNALQILVVSEGSNAICSSAKLH
jgi:hypothetical protein